MPTHKLAAGPITLTIASVSKTEGQFGPQVRFSGANGTDVYVNEAPAERGLARLNLSLDSVVGHTIRFAQVKKDGKTFTNLDPAAAGSEGVEAPNVSAVPAVSHTPKRSVEELSSLYGECVGVAMSQLAARLDDAGIAYDGTVIASAAATVFIQAAK